jgi:hypothetical protein
MSRHTPCANMPNDRIPDLCAAHQYDVCGLIHLFEHTPSIFCLQWQQHHGVVHSRFPPFWGQIPGWNASSDSEPKTVYQIQTCTLSKIISCLTLLRTTISNMIQERIQLHSQHWPWESHKPKNNAPWMTFPNTAFWDMSSSCDIESE